MDPFSKEVLTFIKREKPFNCNNDKPLLVKTNQNTLFIDHSSLSAYNVSHISQLTCRYANLCIRNNDHYKKNCDHGWKLLSNETVITKEDYIKVVCRRDIKKIFQNCYTFVHAKHTVQKKYDNDVFLARSYNVLMIGTDAVSRLNFHRQLSKTSKRLTDLGAIELLGYTKVADETFPNLLPLLTGMSEADRLSRVLPLEYCPWIWENFTEAGFVTGYGEDAPHLSLFTYNKHSLKKKIADFNLMPFMEIVDGRIGHLNKFISNLCIGPQMSIEVLFNYIIKFATLLSSFRTFGFFWSTSLTHDDLNYARFADELYINFLDELHASGTLENTILILLSDHGLRTGKIRSVYQGFLEDRLPYVFFLFPKSFQELYPQAITNLKINTHRLTTPFDLHNTLLDLIHPEKLNKQIIEMRSKELQNTKIKSTSISLFLPIHKFRTCKNARISLFWCTCLRSKVISSNSTYVKTMSIILVDHLNSMIDAYLMCSVLSLAEIVSVRLEFSSFKDLFSNKNYKTKSYIITIRTKPGNALFEGFIRHEEDSDIYHVLGDIIRINTYNDGSKCVTDHHIKKYCYCVKN
ncbi:hypothetical protein C0J52_17442 [Blattella germanica]|nr:hypothetical protein C0J52_17442 [Blattella germanica]